MPGRKRAKTKTKRRARIQAGEGALDARLLAANEMIADFMRASSRIEQFLQEKGELTPLQQQSIETTIQGLQTFWMTWRTHFSLRPAPSRLR